MTKDPRQPLVPGTRIGDYRIDRVIGAGGAGLTYAAVNMPVRRPVAIKEFMPIGLAVRSADGITVEGEPGRRDPFAATRRRFIDEARAVARLHHPSIVPIEHYIQTNGTAYVVMPRIEGETLAVRLRRQGRLRPAEIDALLPPLLSALRAIHAAGLVHGDIKPSNVILRADPGGEDRIDPVLIDFGSARNAGDLAHDHGAPGYAAPEMYHRRGRFTPATDIYGLGALLYRAVTGHPPQSVPDRRATDTMPSAVEAAEAEQRLPLLDAIDRALALDPRHRPRSAAAFEELVARDPAGFTPGRERSARRPLALAAFVAALAIGGGLLAVSSSELGRDPDTSSPGIRAGTDPGAAPPAARKAPLRDCTTCPELARSPAGKPAVARRPVSRAEFAAFVAATGHSLAGGCVSGDGTGGWLRHAEASWRTAGRGDAVVCVSWQDAKAYADWLSARTGKPYRLARPGELPADLAPAPPATPERRSTPPEPDAIRRLTPGAGPGPEPEPGAEPERPPETNPKALDKKAESEKADREAPAEWTARCWAQTPGAGAGLYCARRLVVNWPVAGGRRIRTGVADDLRHRKLGFRVVREAESGE